VVGVNTDASIKELKGNDRPIMDQDNRVTILSAIRWIDYVILFDTKSVLPVIEKIKPQILVKGGNYSKKACAVADRIVGEEYIESYGGKVLTGPMLEGVSSTKIIDKIRKG
jgi:D-beta-D-heptose 7-phosphate kinase/D-beta-D-heptose 1-phosphate adenosyltransferase